MILPVTDPRTKNYLDQYLPALKAHLEEKGWYGRYMQHIADEPTARNAPSYGAISEYVKKHLPGVPVFDAVLTSRELAGAIDVWVPVLDVIHRDWKFYQDLKKQGKEIWFYTCVGPGEITPTVFWSSRSCKPVSALDQLQIRTCRLSSLGTEFLGQRPADVRRFARPR